MRMVTVCGAASASGEETGELVAAVVGRARQSMGEREPDLALFFACPSHPLQRVVADAAALITVPTIACSTAGGIAMGKLQRRGIAVLLCAWGDVEDAIEPLVTLAPRAGDAKPADALTAGYHMLAEQGRERGWTHSATLVLGDGLSPELEQLASQMRRRLPSHHAIFGGGASDDALRERTSVAAGGLVTAVPGAVAVHFVGASPWGVGVGHGALPISGSMTVTAATGNVVHTLDHRPALDLYRELATARGVPLETEEQLANFLIEHELGIHLFDTVARVRGGVGIEPDGSVVYAGEVPEGTTVSFVHGDPEGYIAEARRAAELALQGLGGAKPAGALIISSLTRALALGDDYARELAAINEVLGHGPTAGFLSYGEIARIEGRLDGYHNNSIIVVAIPR